MTVYGGMLKRMFPELKDRISSLDADELSYECSANDARFEVALAYLEGLGASEKLLEELCTVYLGNTIATSMLTVEMVKKSFVTYFENGDDGIFERRE